MYLFRKKKRLESRVQNAAKTAKIGKSPSKGANSIKTAPNLPKAVFPFPKLNKIFILFSLMYKTGKVYNSVPRSNAISCTMSLCICAAV